MIRPPMFMADAGAAALTALDPEKAHRLTVKMLRSGTGPKVRMIAPRLEAKLATKLAGIKFSNPIGLAAGFDKNAEVPNAALDLGFGFVEVGGVTPRPQPGNDRPRVFRLREDRGVINRYGFNNDGEQKIARRLKRRRKIGVVGVNLGANKTSEDKTADFVSGVTALGPYADFLTVNVSSPNTPGLRALQNKAALDELLARVMTARGALENPVPVFLKIAPDLTDEDKADILESAIAAKIDAMIVSNTTIARPDSLISRFSGETGGLSGKPLFAPSTLLLRELYKAANGKMAFVGVGGISSARDAYEKILAGASLVQLYTALIYEGPGLPARILRELPGLLDVDGFEKISDAVGQG